MNYYFVLTQEFFDKYQGTQIGVNQFNAVQDIQGRWVCSINSVIEFPELFKDNAFKVVSLVETDFPTYDEEGNIILPKSEVIWYKPSTWPIFN